MKTLTQLSSAMAAIVGTNIHSAVEAKRSKGNEEPFPVTKWEMSKIRKAAEKRQRRAEKWRREGR